MSELHSTPEAAIAALLGKHAPKVDTQLSFDDLEEESS